MEETTFKEDVDRFGKLLVELAKSVGYVFETPELERMKENDKSQ